MATTFGYAAPVKSLVVLFHVREIRLSGIYVACGAPRQGNRDVEKRTSRKHDASLRHLSAAAITAVAPPSTCSENRRYHVPQVRSGSKKLALFLIL